MTYLLERVKRWTAKLWQNPAVKAATLISLLIQLKPWAVLAHDLLKLKGWA